MQGLGRVPWIIGGGWHQDPGKGTNIWEIGGEIARTGTATHELGGELDWFMVSNAEETGKYHKEPTNRSKDMLRSH